MNAPRPEIVFVAAIARNGVIGRDNQLPWRLKADLAHFRALTYGQPVLMGRKTWDSLGRPLPGRRNLVVSRDPQFDPAGAEVYASIDDALAAAADARQVAVIGGAQIYAALFPVVDRLEFTEVDADVDGDTFFPAYARGAFIELNRQHHPADADNEFAFDFVTYRRQRPAD